MKEMLFTKDEIKNRISMALKDPVLQQGFEIICKENAGLKAGRLTKWHKVADGDLPKRDERFLANISIPVMTQENDFVCYSYDDKKWYSHGVEIGNVIAWCEIPKFEEADK